jgi:hypothetical protein
MPERATPAPVKRVTDAGSEIAWRESHPEKADAAISRSFDPFSNVILFSDEGKCLLPH